MPIVFLAALFLAGKGAFGASSSVLLFVLAVPIALPILFLWHLLVGDPPKTR